MKFIFFGSFIFILSLAACDSNLKETPNGLKFRVVKEGDGILPKPGEVVIFSFKLVDSKDSVWNNTYRSGLPVVNLVRDTSKLRYEKKLKQMLRMVSKGDSIVVSFTIKDYYKDVSNHTMPEGLDTTSTLEYRVHIDSIMQLADYRLWIQGVLAKRRSQIIRDDGQLIDKFLKDKGIRALQDSSGVRYVINNEVSKAKGKSRQTVVVNYNGYFLDGSCFVSNVRAVAEAKGIYTTDGYYKPLEVIIDESSVISGWHIALKLLGKGDKGTFYIPSQLAYGQQGQDKLIKENTILVFDIEVLDIK